MKIIPEYYSHILFKSYSYEIEIIKTLEDMNLKNVAEGVNSPDNITSDSLVSYRFKKLSEINQKAYPNSLYDDEQYLSDLVKILKARSLVVGIGGAGNNTISRLEEMGLKNVETLNINTDANDLYYSNSKQKVLIGKERCNGLGSGNDPFIGLDAAIEDTDRLKKALNADIIFLTCGLGGGTGTGAAPIIAREAKKNNAIVVTFCTIPFRSEGLQRRMRAKTGLAQLAEYSDTLIPIPNDNLLKIIPNAPILTCFKVMDEVLTRTIREVLNTINGCGLVNVDFADVKRIFQKTGEYPSGIIGVTESFGKSQDLIKKAKLALHNPLLNPDTQQVDNCLVSISGNHRLSLSKVDKILTTISKEVPESAKIKFGTNMVPDLGSKIRIMALGKGPISPYVRTAVDSQN